MMMIKLIFQRSTAFPAFTKFLNLFELAVINFIYSSIFQQIPFLKFGFNSSYLVCLKILSTVAFRALVDQGLLGNKKFDVVAT